MARVWPQTLAEQRAAHPEESAHRLDPLIEYI
jgi:hypothetical protein